MHIPPVKPNPNAFSFVRRAYTIPDWLRQQSSALVNLHEFRNYFKTKTHNTIYNNKHRYHIRHIGNVRSIFYLVSKFTSLCREKLYFVQLIKLFTAYKYYQNWKHIAYDILRIFQRHSAADDSARTVNIFGLPIAQCASTTVREGF